MVWVLGILLYFAIGVFMLVRHEVKRRAWYIRHQVGYTEWSHWAVELFGWPILLAEKVVRAIGKALATRLNTYIARKLEPVRIEVELTRKTKR